MCGKEIHTQDDVAEALLRGTMKFAGYMHPLTVTGGVQRPVGTTRWPPAVRISGPSGLLFTFFSCPVKIPLMTERSAPISISVTTLPSYIRASRSESLDVELTLAVASNPGFSECSRGDWCMSSSVPSSCGAVTGSSSTSRQAPSPPKPALLSFPYEE